MRIQDRLTIIETKIKYLEKLIYIVISAIAAQIGINFVV